MSLSVNGNSAFIPKNLTPHEHSSSECHEEHSNNSVSLIFTGGNGGTVNFEPHSTSIGAAHDAPHGCIPHDKSAQSHGGSTGSSSIDEIINMLQSLIQSLIKMISGNSSVHNHGCSNTGDASGKDSTVGPRNFAVRSGDDSQKAAGSEGVTNTSNFGKAPKDMPQDLWKDCVSAGKKFGVDPYVLAAQSKQESNFGKDLSGSSGGDGVMQVEPSTRAAYASQFQEKLGHSYNHGSQSDQVTLAALIMGSKSGDTTSQLQKYNGGDNWKPGATDSYGRVIKADEYAASVERIANELRKNIA